MSRSDDDESGSRATLSRWDIKELRLATSDPLLSDGLPRLIEDPSFVKWLDRLKLNDRRAGKAFVLEAEHSPVVIEIRSFFSDPSTQTLHLNLEIRYGRESFEKWIANTET